MPINTPIIDDWRHGQEGDWVMADDGGIVQLLKVVNKIEHPHDRKNYKYASGWVRTIVGTFIKTSSSTMDTDFSKHPNRYTFSGSNPTKTKDREKCTNREKIFATNIAVGMGPVKALFDAFDRNPNMTQTQARKKAAFLLKQERIMKEVEKSVLDIAKDMGIDHKYVFGKLKQLADNSDDDNIVLQSAKELGKIIGTSGSTVQKRELGILGLVQHFTPEQIESASRRPVEQLKEENNDVE